MALTKEQLDEMFGMLSPDKVDPTANVQPQAQIEAPQALASAPKPVEAEPLQPAPVAAPAPEKGDDSGFDWGRAASAFGGGLGDAISSSYGGNKTNFLQNIQSGFQAKDAAAAKQKEADADRKLKQDDLFATLDEKKRKNLLDIQAEYDKMANTKQTAKEKIDSEEKLAKLHNETLQLIANGKASDSATAKQDKEDARTDKNTQEFGNDIKSFQKPIAVLQNIEKEVLGVPLEKIDYKALDKGKVLINGKEVDLPGVSIPGLGRVSAYSDKAQALQQYMITLFNAELKDQAGTAVSSSELERLKQKYGTGKFNSEADMIRGLIDYKKEMQRLYTTVAEKQDEKVRDKYYGRSHGKDDTESYLVGDALHSNKQAPSAPQAAPWLQAGEVAGPIKDGPDKGKIAIYDKDTGAWKRWK